MSEPSADKAQRTPTWRPVAFIIASGGGLSVAAWSLVVHGSSSYAWLMGVIFAAQLIAGVVMLRDARRECAVETERS